MSQGFPIQEVYFSGHRPISVISDHLYEDVGNPEIICEREATKKPPKLVLKRPWKCIVFSLLVAIILSVTIAGLTWYFVTKTAAPQSSKQLIHNNAKVIIRNAKTLFYLYSEQGKLSHDSQMRNVFLQKFLIPSINGAWILEENERFPGSFRIKSNITGEYLYAGEDSSKYDKERRLIFTWKESNSDLSLRSLFWEFVLVDEATNYYNIKNLEYGDWLCQASDSFGISQEGRIVDRSEAQIMDDKLRRIVFSMHNLKTIGPEGNWIIEQALEGHDHIINYTANDMGERLTYEGEVQNEVPSGSGIMLYKDGSTYVGQWSNGKRQGQGIFYFSKEDSANRSDYVGSWQNDERNGFGTMTWIHGGTYQGNWLNGLQHGKGKYFYSKESDGLSYEGDWFKGERSGKGVLIAKNGDVYEGNFLNDLKHGKGVYTWKNGNKYVGDWLNNNLHGEGVQTSASGEVLQEGKWENNNFVG